MGQQNSNKKLFLTIDTCQEQQKKSSCILRHHNIEEGVWKHFFCENYKSTLLQGLIVTFQQCCLLQDTQNVSFEEDHSLTVLVAPPDHN